VQLDTKEKELFFCAYLTVEATTAGNDCAGPPEHDQGSWIIARFTIDYCKSIYGAY